MCRVEERGASLLKSHSPVASPHQFVVADDLEPIGGFGQHARARRVRVAEGDLELAVRQRPVRRPRPAPSTARPSSARRPRRNRRCHRPRRGQQVLGAGLPQRAFDELGERLVGLPLRVADAEHRVGQIRPLDLADPLFADRRLHLGGAVGCAAVVGRGDDDQRARSPAGPRRSRRAQRWSPGTRSARRDRRSGRRCRGRCRGSCRRGP